MAPKVASSQPVAASTPKQTTKKSKPRRWRPGTVALREIREQQKNVEVIIPRAAVTRLIREIVSEKSTANDIRLQPAAIDALQQGVEQYAIELFETSQRFALHGRRQTIQPDDLKLAQEQMES